MILIKIQSITVEPLRPKWPVSDRSKTYLFKIVSKKISQVTQIFLAFLTQVVLLFLLVFFCVLVLELGPIGE